MDEIEWLRQSIHRWEGKVGAIITDVGWGVMRGKFFLFKLLLFAVYL
jgi:hypothetical protein